MTELEKLENESLQPSAELIRDLAEVDGDIMILGAGGKMGPALSILARKAILKTNKEKKVIAVSRFTDKKLQNKLESFGIETIRADLLDNTQLWGLPEVNNIIFMAGMKFGTTGNESYTWAMNSYMPGKIAEKFPGSRMVVFSTGNIYSYVDKNSGGSVEDDRPGPIGEYAESCLGRERIFQYFSVKNNSPTVLFRLNYAVDFRYGVMVEIARSVFLEKEIDLSTGFVNLIWQEDACEYALRSLKHCHIPPLLLNVTGPGIISVRSLAEEFARIFNKQIRFTNKELPTALLSNAGRLFSLLGPPKTSLDKMTELIALWVAAGGDHSGKPTHFQERQGLF